MSKQTQYIFLFVVLLFIIIPQAYAKEYVIGEQSNPAIKPDPSSIYVGSEKCKTCHQDQYNNWKTSGHPYKLNTPEEAKAFGIPFPDGYAESDIYLVIGGWGWKARYIDNNGYIITTTGADKKTNGSNQYNIETKTWSDYSPGAKKPYDCGKCHTTGYSPEGRQDNKPGIVGTWVEKGVSCEVCHGPGSVHVAKGGGKGVGILKNVSAELCGMCHTRGADSTKIMSKDGFVEHHEQYPEFLNSPHKDLSCVTCHNPHKGVHIGATNPTQGGGIKTACATCHEKQNTDFTGSTMQKKGVTCIDCHMPQIGKSAVGNASKFQGDVKEHIFKINTDVNAKMFSDDGKFATGQLTVDWTCLKCHNSKDKAWASQYASGIHKYIKPEAAATTQTTVKAETEKTPEKTPGFELFFTISALLIALVLRRR